MIQSKAQSIIEEYLSNREPQVVKNAARALAALGDDSALSHLVKLATEHDASEAQIAACERILLLGPEPAQSAARKLAAFLKDTVRWRGAYQLVAKLDARGLSTVARNVPIQLQLWLATKASTLFSWERFRKSILKSSLISLGLAFVAMFLLVIGVSPFPQLDTRDPDYLYLWGAVIPATLTHIGSRLVTTSVDCHPFKLAAYTLQTLIVAALTGLIVATTFLITMRLPDIKLDLPPLPVAWTMALSAITSRTLVLITRESLPKTAGSRVIAFSLAALGSSSVLIYLFARIESAQTILLRSTHLLAFQRGMFAIAFTTLLTLTFHFAASEPVQFRGMGRRTTARVVLAAVALAAGAVFGMGWQRTPPGHEAPNEVTCQAGGDAPRRVDFYPESLPVVVGIHVNENEGLVRVAMPEHMNRPDGEIDYAVSVGKRLPGSGPVQVAKDSINGDDPPVAELDVTKGQYAAAGGLSGFREKSGDDAVPSVAIATNIATSFGARLPTPYTNWHFSDTQTQLLSVACGKVAWPRVIDSYIKTYPIRPGMQVKAKRLAELRNDPTWNTKEDSEAGKSMTVATIGLDTKGNQEFYSFENSIKWSAAWVDALPEPNRPEPLVEVVTPLGRYAPGVKVIRREGNSSGIYVIRAIGDSRSDKSRSGYDVTLTYRGGNRISSGHGDDTIAGHSSSGDVCESTECVTDLEGWVPVK